MNEIAINWDNIKLTTIVANTGPLMIQCRAGVGWVFQQLQITSKKEVIPFIKQRSNGEILIYTINLVQQFDHVNVDPTSDDWAHWPVCPTIESCEGSSNVRRLSTLTGVSNSWIVWTFI